LNDFFIDIAIGGGNDTNINVSNFGTAEPVKFTFLDDS